MERDFRRGAGDPMAARLIWSARCTAGRDCLSSVRYNDAALDTTSPAQRLTTSEQGTCYECELAGGPRPGGGALPRHHARRVRAVPAMTARTR
jgi:hypothetical protein